MKVDQQCRLKIVPLYVVVLIANLLPNFAPNKGDFDTYMQKNVWNFKIT